MNDFLKEFEKYKDIKDIADIIQETNKLRELYQNSQFNEMLQHINLLTKKYVIETIIWNISHPYSPANYYQAYLTAENFMKANGIKVLVEKDIKISKELLGEN